MATATSDISRTATNEHIDAPALGVAGALVSAAGMLLLGIAANLGVYEDAAARMMDWHMFFTLSPGGIVAGMVEAAVISFVFLVLFAATYNLVADWR